METTNQHSDYLACSACQEWTRASEGACAHCNQLLNQGGLMWWSSSSGRIELNLTKAQAAQGSHSGVCDADIAYLRTVSSIRRQLEKLDPVVVNEELKEYGAWDEEERANHDDNLDRLLWIACGDIVEGNL